MKGFGISISDIMRCPERQMDVSHYGVDGVCAHFKEFRMASNPIMKHFEYGHLPEHLQEVSKRFCELAQWCDDNLPHDAETSTALRKLLEGKDAAVRARNTQPAGA